MMLPAEVMLLGFALLLVGLAGLARSITHKRLDEFNREQKQREQQRQQEERQRPQGHSRHV